MHSGLPLLQTVESREARFVKNFFSLSSGAVIRTIGRRWKVASWGGVAKEKSGSWAACDFAWEVAILFWAIPCVEETPAVPGYYAASGGGFWQSSSYIQVDIWQGSAWRGLCRALPPAPSDPSFSIGVSQ